MWFIEPPSALASENISFDFMGKIAVIICVIGTLLLGVYPNVFFYVFNFVVK